MLNKVYIIRPQVIGQCRFSRVSFFDDAYLPPDQREALRQSGIPGHALYWIDGRRTVSEVAERLTVALGQPVAVAAVGAFLDRMQAIGFLDA